MVGNAAVWTDIPTVPFFEREIKNAVLNVHLKRIECVALIGPRQIGKSAFAKKLAAELGGSVCQGAS